MAAILTEKKNCIYSHGENDCIYTHSENDQLTGKKRRNFSSPIFGNCEYIGVSVP